MPQNEKEDECKKTRIEILSSFLVDSYEEIGHDEMVNEVLVGLLLAKSELQKTEEEK